MKKTLLVTGLMIGILIIGSLWWYLPKVPLQPPLVSSPSKESVEKKEHNPYQIPRLLRYSFTLKNTGHRVLKNAEFWTYAPVKQTATQQVIHIEASHPHNIVTDTLGNQVLHFVLAPLPPYASRVIHIKVILKLAQKPNWIPETQLPQFLAEEPLIEVTHPQIQKTAKNLLKTDTLSTSRAIFAWVAEHIQYAGYLRDSRGALYALRQKRGDCTEYMSLFTALARANGIPARGIGGYVYADDAILQPENYHNWAEFYLDGRWQIADVQKKVFMDKQANYIATRIISAQSNLTTSHRFWYSGKGLKVKMN